MPVDAPRKRTTGLSLEPAGDDLVIWDSVNNHYHTLNSTARAVWSACDGSISLADLPALLDLHPGIVGFAVRELLQAGLLEDPTTDLASDIVPTHLTRRQIVTRLAAAGLLGAVALPAVGSITGADSTAAVSCFLNQCLPGCPNAFLPPCICGTQPCTPGCPGALQPPCICTIQQCFPGCPLANTCTCQPALCG